MTHPPPLVKNGEIRAIGLFLLGNVRLLERETEEMRAGDILYGGGGRGLTGSYSSPGCRRCGRRRVPVPAGRCVTVR